MLRASPSRRDRRTSTDATNWAPCLMARIRTVKPSFWSDGEVAELSIEARFLLLGLISFADDEGRFVASPSAIAGYVYPHDELPPVKLKRWLAELEATRTVRFYVVGSRRYGWFPQYTKHQRISHPQGSS